jgi:MinD-like ATPase involved in chromosome partitioning or flagellar assembly
MIPTRREPIVDGRPVRDTALARLRGRIQGLLVSSGERQEADLERLLRSGPGVTRANTVAVASPKGGVGKTTIAFLMGGMLASHRLLSVVAVDANPEFGTLADLASDHRGERSLADLLFELDDVATAAQLRRYVSQLPSGLHLLAAPHAAVTPGEYGRLLAFLSIFYEVVILDLGTGITDPLAQFAVDRADQTVVITTPEWVTAAGVLGALRYLQLEQGTLVLNQAPVGRHTGNREVIEANFRRHAVETSATIPYDDRLRVMLDTGTYSLSDLKLSTRVPVKELGAAIAFNFV